MRRKEIAALLLEDDFLQEIIEQVQAEYVQKWARELDAGKRLMWWVGHNMAEDVRRHIVGAASE
jgi:hypothetical protein